MSSRWSSVSKSEVLGWALGCLIHTLGYMFLPWAVVGGSFGMRLGALAGTRSAAKASGFKDSRLDEELVKRENLHSFLDEDFVASLRLMPESARIASVIGANITHQGKFMVLPWDFFARGTAEERAALLMQAQIFAKSRRFAPYAFYEVLTTLILASVRIFAIFFLLKGAPFTFLQALVLSLFCMVLSRLFASVRFSIEVFLDSRADRETVRRGHHALYPALERTLAFELANSTSPASSHFRKLLTWRLDNLADLVKEPAVK